MNSSSLLVMDEVELQESGKNHCYPQKLLIQYPFKNFSYNQKYVSALNTPESGDKP